MTDELLPALPEPKWIAVDTPGADFDVTFVRSVREADEMDEGAPPSHREPLHTADQLRAYAREAIRLSHTWPTLRDDDAMTHPHLEGLIRKWREEAKALRDHPSYYVETRSREVIEAKEAAANDLANALAALPGGGVEELRAEIARLERAVEDAKYRSMVDARISYHGFSYGTGSQWGIDSLREAIRKGGDA